MANSLTSYLQKPANNIHLKISSSSPNFKKDKANIIITKW